MTSSQRNGAIAGIVILGGLVLVGVTIFRPSRGAGDMPQTYTVQGVCLACQKEGAGTMAVNDYPPLKCPACGKPALYTWFYCLSCNKRCVPALARPVPNGPLRLPLQPVCPACGSRDVRQWDPVMPEQQAAAALPLPKWEP
jgi:hypothetical protein